jgi:hypothetical protein
MVPVVTRAQIYKTCKAWAPLAA